MGNVRLHRIGSLQVDVASGDIEVDGDVDASTNSGRVRIAAIRGGAVVKNINGGTAVGDVTGELRMRSSNGDILIGRAGADVDVKSANGGIRVGRVESGRIDLGTSSGTIEIGIGAGTVAWLDVRTGFGRVENELEAGSGPQESERTAKVHARTSHGDVFVRRVCPEPTR